MTLAITAYDNELLPEEKRKKILKPIFLKSASAVFKDALCECILWVHERGFQQASISDRPPVPKNGILWNCRASKFAFYSAVTGVCSAIKLRSQFQIRTAEQCINFRIKRSELGVIHAIVQLTTDQISLSKHLFQVQVKDKYEVKGVLTSARASYSKGVSSFRLLLGSNAVKLTPVCIRIHDSKRQTFV